MSGRAIAHNSALLALVGICTTVLIMATYHFTRDRIAVQEREAQEQPLLQIIPRARHDNAMLDDTISVGPHSAGLGLRDDRYIYVARQHGNVVAVIIPVIAPDGYAGDIELLVGVNRDGTIAGVRALNHNETPGLGDQVDIEQSGWVRSFDGRSLVNPTVSGWSVAKDGGVFDQFTGATITPRAVVAAILRALHFAEANRAALFGDGGDDGPAPAGGDT